MKRGKNVDENIHVDDSPKLMLIQPSKQVLIVNHHQDDIW